jgi:hypothetical protein
LPKKEEPVSACVAKLTRFVPFGLEATGSVLYASLLGSLIDLPRRKHFSAAWTLTTTRSFTGLLWLQE